MQHFQLLFSVGAKTGLGKYLKGQALQRIPYQQCCRVVILLVAGGFAAAQYVFEPLTVQGITLPTRRRAYMRDASLLPIYERLMVSIDISDVSFL